MSDEAKHVKNGIMIFPKDFDFVSPDGHASCSKLENEESRFFLFESSI